MHVFTHLKPESEGKTGLGVYPDGMVELDGYVGQMLDKLDELGIADNTVVMFTTDNGAEVLSWPDPGAAPVSRCAAAVGPGRRRRPARQLAGDPLHRGLCLAAAGRRAGPAAWLRSGALAARLPASGRAAWCDLRHRRPESACRSQRSGESPWPVTPNRLDTPRSPGNTVVSTRIRLVRNSFASAALANNASLSPSTAALPHRLFSFINVDRMRHRTVQRDPAEPPPGDRIRHLPAQRLKAQPVAKLQEHHRR